MKVMDLLMRPIILAFLRWFFLINVIKFWKKKYRVYDSTQHKSWVFYNCINFSCRILCFDEKTDIIYHYRWTSPTLFIFLIYIFFHIQAIKFGNNFGLNMLFDTSPDVYHNHNQYALCGLGCVWVCHPQMYFFLFCWDNDCWVNLKKWFI